MPSTTGDRIVTVAAGILIGFAIGVPTGAAITAANENHAAPAEDEPGFSCVDDGNRICGPGNAEGKPAGCYDTGGVLVAPWPCHLVVNPATGEGDVYTGQAELGMGAI